MDIRNIKELPPEPEKEVLDSIFKLQANLLAKYQALEKLPPYPVSLHHRESQVLLKGFTARVTEELGEAYESYEAMLYCFHNGIEGDEIINHLYNFNEELSDALHFLMETLIYTGVTLKYIRDFYNVPESHSTINFLMELGLDELSKDQFFIRNYPSYWVIKNYQEGFNEFIRGGRKISVTENARIKLLMFSVMYKLQLTRNTLKNKPWKQSEMITDEFLFTSYLLGSFFELIKLFGYLGMTENSIYRIYFNKNQINLFRIKSNY